MNLRTRDVSVSAPGTEYKLSERSATRLFNSNGVYDPVAGIPVNARSAMTHSGVYRCVSLIAACIAACRAMVIQQSKDDPTSITLVTDYNKIPAVNILTRTPDFDTGLTPYSFFENLIIQYLLMGDGYAQVYWNSRGQATRLGPLPYNWVSPEWDDDGRKIYKVYPDGKYGRTGKRRRPDEVLQVDEMIHLADLMDGDDEWLHGTSRIKRMAQEVSLGLASTRNSARYFKHGRPLGFIKTKEFLKKSDKDKLQEEWEQMHASPWSVGVLGNEADWVPMALSAKDIQLIETREFQIADIARFFGVPSFLLGLANKEGYKSAEQLFRSFITSTLGPIITKLEQELRLKLFTRDESFNYHVRFDMDDMSRGDTQATSESFERQLRHGVLLPNEWRRAMWRPKLQGLSKDGTNIGDIALAMASQLATLKDTVDGTANLGKGSSKADGAGGKPGSSTSLLVTQDDRLKTAQTMVEELLAVLAL